MTEGKWFREKAVEKGVEIEECERQRQRPTPGHVICLYISINFPMHGVHVRATSKSGRVHSPRRQVGAKTSLPDRERTEGGRGGGG